MEFILVSMDRVLLGHIQADLQKKMVFLSGPRQVGKTWLAKHLLAKAKQGLYLNYDNRLDRKVIENQEWLSDTDLLVFDEIHKMPDWKNYLKGVFDTRSDGLQILVTGSARLEAFRQVGDSLAGRYFRHRLLPITLAELKQIGEPISLDSLLVRGGFPEPYLAKSNTEAGRWRSQYIDSLIRTDVLDFEAIHDFRAIQLVLQLLRKRVGSPVSYSSIAEDVGVAPNTVKKYIEIFESLYIVFRVTPFADNIARSLLKEPKIYFFDTGFVDGDEGARFENFVGVSLLKHCWASQDLDASEMHLHYLRTKEKREVDFCIVESGKPQRMIEAKLRDDTATSALWHFHEKYGIPGTQLVMHCRKERMDAGIEIRSALKFLQNLRS